MPSMRTSLRKIQDLFHNVINYKLRHNDCTHMHDSGPGAHKETLHTLGIVNVSHNTKHTNTTLFPTFLTYPRDIPNSALPTCTPSLTYPLSSAHLLILRPPGQGCIWLA